MVSFIGMSHRPMGFPDLLAFHEGNIKACPWRGQALFIEREYLSLRKNIFKAVW